MSPQLRHLWGCCVVLCAVLFFHNTAHAEPTYHIVQTDILRTELETDNYNLGSVAHYGDNLIVGGTQRRGIIEIFERDGKKAWKRTKRITGTGAMQFGSTVAIHKDIFAASIPNAPNQPSRSGVVRVYKKAGNDWILDVTLTPPKPVSSGGFGQNLHFISQTELLVSMYQAEEGSDLEGAVYLYKKKPDGMWSLSQTITPNTATFKEFGISMDYNDKRLVIASNLGSTSDNVFLFERDAQGMFQQKNIISTPMEHFQFGYKLALHKQHLIVSASTMNSAGTVYHYILPETLSDAIGQPKQLANPQRSNIDRFGAALHFHNNVLFVADQNSVGGRARVQLYTLSGQQWQPSSSVYSVNTDEEGIAKSQRYGLSIVTSGNQLFVSAPNERSFRGAVYVYDINIFDTTKADLSKIDESQGWRLGAVGTNLLLTAPLADIQLLDAGGLYIYDTLTATLTPLLPQGLPQGGEMGSAMTQNDDYVVVSAPKKGKIFVFARMADGSLSSEISFDMPSSTLGAAMHLTDDNTLYAQQITAQTNTVAIYKLNGAMSMAAGNLSIADMTAERFGHAITSIGDQIFVAAPRAAASRNAGAVYVFQKESNGAHTQIEKITNGLQPGFGQAIATQNNTLIVGEVDKTAFADTPLDEITCVSPGAIHIFAKGASWQKVQTLLSPMSQPDCFGASLRVIEDTLFALTPRANIFDTNILMVRERILKGNGLVHTYAEVNNEWVAFGGMAIHDTNNQSFGQDIAQVQDAFYVSSLNTNNTALHSMRLHHSVDAPTDNLLTGETSLTFTGMSSPNATLTIELTDGPDKGKKAEFEPDLSGQWSYQFDQPLQTGEHVVNISLRQTDAIQAQTITRTFVIDAELPSTPTITSPATDTYLNDNQPTIEGTTSTSIAIECTFQSVIDGTERTLKADSVSDAQGAWSCTPTEVLQDGMYTLSVKAISGLGNESASATTTFTVDTQAPDAPMVDDIDTSKNPVRFQGTAEPLATVHVTINVNEVTTTTSADENGNWSLTLGQMLDETNTYLLRTWQIDRAGNTSEILSRPFAFNDVVIEQQRNNPPNLGSLNTFEPNARLRISIIQDANPSVRFEYDTQADDAGSWSFSVPDALDAGVYTVIVEELDERGETTTVYAFKIRVDFVAETFSPAYCQSAEAPYPQGSWLFMAAVCIGLFWRRRKSTTG